MCLGLKNGLSVTWGKFFNPEPANPCLERNNRSTMSAACPHVPEPGGAPWSDPSDFFQRIKWYLGHCLRKQQKLGFCIRKVFIKH